MTEMYPEEGVQQHDKQFEYEMRERFLKFISEDVSSKTSNFFN
jgi:hypothetical protein